MRNPIGRMAISNPSKCFAGNRYYLKLWKQRMSERDALPIILIIVIEAICVGCPFIRLRTAKCLAIAIGPLLCEGS